jgi:hypothetical protein
MPRDAQCPSTVQDEEPSTPVTPTTKQNTNLAPQNNAVGHKRRATAGGEVESKKRKGTDRSKPPATGEKGHEEKAQNEPQKLRLSTSDLEFDYDRSQLRDPRPTPGRKARPRYEETDVPRDLKTHLELTRYIPKPEKPPGRLNRFQKNQLYIDEARMNPYHAFHSLYVCHDKGREGSPTYDSAGFELDYAKVAEWMNPRAYNKEKMVRGMERAVANAESEETQMSKLFFEEVPTKPDGMSHRVKDFIKDHVSKDLGIPWHHVKLEQVKMWRDKGFQPVRYKDWWKEPTAEENMRMLKLLSGASLRK